MSQTAQEVKPQTTLTNLLQTTDLKSTRIPDNDVKDVNVIMVVPNQKAREDTSVESLKKLEPESTETSPVTADMEVDAHRDKTVRAVEENESKSNDDEQLMESNEEAPLKESVTSGHENTSAVETFGNETKPTDHVASRNEFQQSEEPQPSNEGHFPLAQTGAEASTPSNIEEKSNRKEAIESVPASAKNNAFSFDIKSEIQNGDGKDPELPVSTSAENRPIKSEAQACAPCDNEIKPAPEQLLEANVEGKGSTLNHHTNAATSSSSIQTEDNNATPILTTSADPATNGSVTITSSTLTPTFPTSKSVIQPSSMLSSSPASGAKSPTSSNGGTLLSIVDVTPDQSYKDVHAEQENQNYPHMDKNEWRFDKTCMEVIRSVLLEAMELEPVSNHNPTSTGKQEDIHQSISHKSLNASEEALNSDKDKKTEMPREMRLLQCIDDMLNQGFLPDPEGTDNGAAKQPVSILKSSKERQEHETPQHGKHSCAVGMYQFVNNAVPSSTSSSSPEPITNNTTKTNKNSSNNNSNPTNNSTTPTLQTAKQHPLKSSTVRDVIRHTLNFLRKTHPTYEAPPARANSSAIDLSFHTVACAFVQAADVAWTTGWHAIRAAEEEEDALLAAHHAAFSDGAGGQSMSCGHNTNTDMQAKIHASQSKRAHAILALRSSLTMLLSCLRVFLTDLGTHVYRFFVFPPSDDPYRIKRHEALLNMGLTRVRRVFESVLAYVVPMLVQYWPFAEEDVEVGPLPKKKTGYGRKRKRIGNAYGPADIGDNNQNLGNETQIPLKRNRTPTSRKLGDKHAVAIYKLLRLFAEAQFRTKVQMLHGPNRGVKAQRVTGPLLRPELLQLFLAQLARQEGWALDRVGLTMEDVTNKEKDSACNKKVQGKDEERDQDEAEDEDEGPLRHYRYSGKYQMTQRVSSTLPEFKNDANAIGVPKEIAENDDVTSCTDTPKTTNTTTTTEQQSPSIQQPLQKVHGETLEEDVDIVCFSIVQYFLYAMKNPAALYSQIRDYDVPRTDLDELQNKLREVLTGCEDSNNQAVSSNGEENASPAVVGSVPNGNNTDANAPATNATPTHLILLPNKNSINLSQAKTALAAYYGKRHGPLSNESFRTWNNHLSPHELKWTSVFTCPLTQKTFPSGKFGNPEKFDFQPHDATAEVHSAKDGDSQGGIVWHGTKKSAEHAAAASALLVVLAQEEKEKDEQRQREKEERERRDKEEHEMQTRARSQSKRQKKYPRAPSQGSMRWMSRETPQHVGLMNGYMPHPHPAPPPPLPQPLPSYVETMNPPFIAPNVPQVLGPVNAAEPNFSSRFPNVPPIPTNHDYRGVPAPAAPGVGMMSSGTMGAPVHTPMPLPMHSQQPPQLFSFPPRPSNTPRW